MRTCSAVVDLAAFACGDSSQVIPFDVSKKAVASAMAKAVASVLSTCEGQGNAEATVSGLARAEAKAKAVGESTVRVLASSEVCKLCQSSLESFVSVAKTVTANAVAEARVQVRSSSLSCAVTCQALSCTQKHLPVSNLLQPLSLMLQPNAGCLPAFCTHVRSLRMQLEHVVGVYMWRCLTFLKIRARG